MTTIRKVTNIDGIEKQFNTDEEFLVYARKIYSENEDENEPSKIHWSPENIQQAIEYIEEYCPDLILVEL